MKKRNKFEWHIIIVIIVTILLVATVFFIGDESLDLESDELNNLYNYLGEVDIYRCGGLLTYNESDTSINEISSEKALCNAYYNATNTKENKIKKTGINLNKTEICKVGDNATFKVEENTNECSYITISKKDMNQAYNKIYGEDIPKYENKFQISNSKVCYLEGDTYYCGETETYIYSIGNDATIYRLKEKAIKTRNDKIIIYDYFIRISNNTCYISNSNTSEFKDCTEEYKKNNKVDADFIKKYGNLYKHTFLKGVNNNYYWSKSEPKPPHTYSSN